MRLGIKIIGYLLVALIFAGLCLTLLMASTSGQAFVGRNVYHLPIGTYSTLAILAMAAGIGCYAIIRRIRRRPD
ncbi:MAG: hypothetical protein K0M78_03925 [Brevundimonas sp.]|nr:hypothetical protein [Brevundimonas sp.]